MKGMKPPNDVQDLLDFLVAGLRRSLGDNLCGVYLRGSLALGDFVPATSDVDVLAVTEQPVSELSTRNSSHCMQRWTLCPTPTPTVWR